MNFTVVYSPDAEDFLAELWLVGPDRQEITLAQYHIDQILSTDPFLGAKGREGLFRLVVPPLSVVYEIHEEDRMVKVTGVGRISLLHSGWGAGLVDYDNDGWKDLFVGQGHSMDTIQKTQPALSYFEPLPSEGPAALEDSTEYHRFPAASR